VPIYEYRCEQCGKTFEYTQRISEEPKKVCEACGGPLERLISQTSFALKGSGWYKDLYSSKKPGGSDSAAKSGADGGGSAGASGSSGADSGSTAATTDGSSGSPTGGGTDTTAGKKGD
jgi:putative FmdB family regulatory protein